MRWFVLCMGVLLSACERPTYKPPPTPTPEAIPTPTPTPTIPRKPLDVSQLFNGITLFTKLATPPSDHPASFERPEAKLYKNKIDFVRERLNRLDLILPRHNFYDCETILELQDPESGRKALLMQGD